MVTFWRILKLKIWISGALFEQKIFSFDNLTHVIIWAKGELAYKYPLEVSPQVTTSESTKSGQEKLIHNSQKNNFKLGVQSKYYIKIKIISPWTQDVNWTYIRRSEDVKDVFWTSYIRSVYVLCPWEWGYIN